MSYTPNSPNAYDKGLIPTKVRAQYFQEILLASPLSMFMGSSPTSMIQVVNQENGNGPTSTFSLLRELDYKNPIKGYEQISGKGQNLKFYTDTINIEKLAWADKLNGIQLTKLYTPINVFDALKPSLQLVHKQALTFEILRAATTDNYPVVANGPVDNRVVYSGAAYNANMDTAITAMNAGPKYDENGVSVDGIMELRDIARNGGKASYRQEKRITPYQMETKRGFPAPRYVYMMDPPSYRKLAKDPQFAAQFNRGVIESSDQPSILNGGYYRGRIDDVYLYEVPELGDFRFKTADSSVTASWNLFCGAQAFGVIFRGAPWFTTEYTNHDTVVEMAVHEMRGQKALKFPSYQDEAVNIENGIIHHFARINA